jgi:hypothetical protein
MTFERNLNRPLRLIYIVLGVALLAYALYAHLLVSGIALLIAIVLGAAFLVAGATGT